MLRKTATARVYASTDTVEQQLMDAIAQHGLTPPVKVIFDGKIHRFASSGKRGDTSGWYICHGGDVPAGAFGCWRQGVDEKWRADIGRKLTLTEETAHNARLKAICRAREAETKKQRTEAKAKAKAILTKAPAATGDHAYLRRKNVKAHGIHIHKGALVVPASDISGEVQTLQFIEADGKKSFLSGGQIKGCSYLIGELGNTICIVEGYATGATIHEATGYPAVVAFNAGNLKAVAETYRKKYPDSCIVLCADDDWKTAGNPGLAKAREATQAVGGLLAIPAFKPDRPDKATDFNDMAALYSIEAVKNTIFGVTEVTGVQANDSADSTVTPDIQDGVTGDTKGDKPEIPKAGDRPCFRVFDDWHKEGEKKCRPGVWCFSVKESKSSDPVLTEQWICSPLHIDAITFDAQDNNFGRLLRFLNPLKRWREWAMPMELLRGSGDELRGELLAMGVEIAPQAKNLLAHYLQSVHPKRRVQCALQAGWCDSSFVLPDVVIGAKASGVIFQSGERGRDEYTCAGTLEGWKTGVAAFAVGNPMLMTALSGAFAGALLAKCNAESGGLHFVGDSSTGKTRGLIDSACSVWGGENYKRSWRATANGMEGVSSMFNDGLLALDEISECDPREIGAIVYALGNGRGKQRASRTGNARSVKRWRCFVLSSGERSIETAMADGGCRTKAGQDVRLPSVPVERPYGVFDDLHGMESGAALTDAIKQAAKTHYGHTGRAFLERLTRDPRDFSALWERMKALPQFSLENNEGQDKRVAGRFALLAMAGELATEYGLTGWQEGAATDAAAQALKAWRNTRNGHGNNEKKQIIEAVSAFVDQHGDGRFSNADKMDDGKTLNRAGWWRDDDNGRVYLFTSAGMHEALKGFEFKRGLDALQDAGALPPPSADGKRSKPQRIGGRQVRLYPVNAEKLEADHGD